MLRRNWRRFIPIYAILPLATTGLMNLFAYQLPKLIQLLLHSARSYDLTSALDVQFPFRPGWIWVYIATFLFWVYQYTTVARESPERACRLSDAVHLLDRHADEPFPLDPLLRRVARHALPL